MHDKFYNWKIKAVRKNIQRKTKNTYTFFFFFREGGRVEKEKNAYYKKSSDMFLNLKKISDNLKTNTH